MCRYEDYCTKKLVDEVDVLEERGTLLMFGISVFSKKDSTTDVFRHLLFVDEDRQTNGTPELYCGFPLADCRPVCCP